MPIGSFTSNRNINATTPHATPITVCQRPPRRRPLHPGPAVVACRKSLARKESRRGLSHPRSSPHTQRIAESKRAAPFSDSAALHDRQVSICGSLLCRLSSCRVSRDLPPLTTATRSSYVGLLSLALPVTSAHWQPDTPATSTLPPPVVKPI